MVVASLTSSAARNASPPVLRRPYELVAGVFARDAANAAWATEAVLPLPHLTLFQRHGPQPKASGPTVSNADHRHAQNTHFPACLAISLAEHAAISTASGDLSRSEASRLMQYFDRPPLPPFRAHPQLQRLTIVREAQAPRRSGGSHDPRGSVEYAWVAQTSLSSPRRFPLCLEIGPANRRRRLCLGDIGSHSPNLMLTVPCSTSSNAVSADSAPCAPGAGRRQRQRPNLRFSCVAKASCGAKAWFPASLTGPASAVR